MATSGKPIVYMATNSVNGKRYVGVTKRSLNSRRGQHFASARRNSHYRLHSAIRKYGESAFTFVVLNTLASYQEALACEIRTIALLKPEYNSTAGGEGVVGLFVSEENRRRSSERHRGNKYWVGKKHRPESIARMRESQRGNTNASGQRSPETSERLRAATLAAPTRYWLGKKRSKETIDKIRKAKVGAVTHEACIIALHKHRAIAQELSAQKRRKPIVCVTDGLIFSCAIEAAKNYGISIHALRNSIKRGTKTRCGRLSFVYDEAA